MERYGTCPNCRGTGNGLRRDLLLRPLECYLCGGTGFSGDLESPFLGRKKELRFTPSEMKKIVFESLGHLFPESEK